MSEKLIETLNEEGHTQIIVLKRRDFKHILGGGEVYSVFKHEGRQYCVVMSLDAVPTGRRPTSMMGMTPLYLAAPRKMWQKIKRGASRSMVEKLRVDGKVLYLELINEAGVKEMTRSES